MFSFCFFCCCGFVFCFLLLGWLDVLTVCPFFGVVVLLVLAYVFGLFEEERCRNEMK